MVLPGPHKDLWGKLDDEKKRTPKDKQGYLYAEDPFLAERERKAAMAKAAKQAESDGKNKKADIKIDLGKNNAEGDGGGNRKRVRFNNVLGMSKQIQLEAEEVIRRHHGFKLISSGTTAIAGKVNSEQVRVDLKKLGFQTFQIEESLLYASSLSDCLEWLLIHVPEDDLPEMFTERNHKHQVSANVQTNDLKVEYAVRHIKQFGFGEDVIYNALKVCGGDKERALVKLTHDLVYETLPTQQQSPESGEFWHDEVQSLIAIYGESNVKSENSNSTVKVVDEQVGEMTFWKSLDYPASIPGIGIAPQNASSVPKYALLNLIKQTGKYAADHLTGDFMLSSIIEWLRDNVSTVLQNPPKLTEITGAVTGDHEQADDETGLSSSGKGKNSSNSRRMARRIKVVSESAENIKQEYDSQLESSKKLQQSIQARQQLPAWQKASEIVKLIHDNQVVLITGETGSGKSTQIVQFVLDDLIKNNKGNQCNIICTQPRRISAMGLAQRVADERDSPVGGIVGYSIRGESKVSDKTMIRFVTAGVLLRMLQADPTGALTNVSHVVVDEIHERSLDSSYLLILLKRLMKRSPKLKIILMSATVDTTAFFKYFDNKIGYTHIEGRTFPVTDYYLDDVIQITKYVPKSLMDEDGVTSDNVGRVIIALRNGIDYSLIAHVVNHIDSQLPASGSILIFMSGAAEIDNAIASIQSSTNGSKFHTLPLHASLTPAEQRRVFDKAPKGLRKVVVSTNVAETSITIPDAMAVVDSGRVKATVYEAENNVVRLVDSWASQAEVTQRRGRAGRVQEGICYKLYTRNIQEKEMAKEPAPEMQRAPLEQLYLSVKAMGINDTQKFLAEALDPPDSAALETARQILSKSGALDEASDQLTPLGKHISTIPADVRCAKLLILSAVFGCLNKGLTLVSILSIKSPFVSPREKREEAKEAQMAFAKDGQGDLLAATMAYEEWVNRKKTQSSSKVRNWCKDNFLSLQTLFDIESSRRQFLTALQEVGFTPSDRNLPPYFNDQDNNEPLIRAIIGAALSPNLAEIVFPEKVFKTSSSGAVEQDPESRGIKFFTEQDGRVFVHPSSTMFGANKFVDHAHYISFGSKMSTSKLFINNITPLGTYGMVFFSQGNIAVDPLGSGVIVRDWIGLKCWPRVGILIKILGNLFNKVLEDKFLNPEKALDKDEIIPLVRRIIEREGR
ncbi:hypothetical protein TRICI_003174 [Trichomonascus ciferrii]|uniref:RNA helicase n=1 Tax=Trichomonascus ciferrii TaxID=44093 RepID=A0A642V9S5_9ASCO|nr:hypothetical protein TRICI_003174 [Trichomonascus ciferrii]